MCREIKTGDIALTDKVKNFIKIRDKKPGNVFCGLVHRLDRPVSGLVILAKTSKGLSRLNEVFREGKIEKYSSNTKEIFNIIGHFAERDYGFSFSSNGFSFPSSEREFKEVDSDCELERNEAFDKTEESTLDFSPSLPDGRYGQRFVNSEGELLAGQKEITGGDGSKMIWDWSLARCGK